MAQDQAVLVLREAQRGPVSDFQCSIGIMG